MVDITAVKKAMERANKDYPNSVFLLGKDPSRLAVQTVSTKIPALDALTDGGIPRRRLVQMYGPESAGKSSLALYFTSLFEMCVYIDAEHTFDPTRTGIFGANMKHIVLNQPKTMEEAFQFAQDMIEAGTPFIIIDSVPALTPVKEIQNDDLEQVTQLGLRASFFSRRISYLCALCNIHNSTVLLVNQIRDNMKAMRFGDPYALPGGHAIKHASSVIWKTQKKDRIVSAGEVLGQIIKVSVTKSKISAPHREAEIALIFDKGFLPEYTSDSLLREAKEARKRSLLRQKSGFQPILVDPEDTSSGIIDIGEAS